MPVALNHGVYFPIILITQACYNSTRLLVPVKELTIHAEQRKTDSTSQTLSVHGFTTELSLIFINESNSCRLVTVSTYRKHCIRIYFL